MRKSASHLLVMLLVTAGVFVVGAAQKAPCVSDSFLDAGTGGRFPCYTDLVALIRTEQLEHGRVPMLDPCRTSTAPCDEYPVGTMLAIYTAARLSGLEVGPFFVANALMLLFAALLTTWALERMGARTILFAAAPALALYGSLNWDLLAVAAATVATLLFLRRGTLAAGFALGAGAVAKLYPALLLLPFGVDRHRDHDDKGAWRMIVGASVVWLACNVPFAIGGTNGWLEVFQLNRVRGADFESMWAVLCQLNICLSTTALNLLGPILTSAAIWWVWHRVSRQHPDTPRWLFAFPMLVIVILLGKFWSPQYALWLLPWFALSRIRMQTWLAYQLTEVLEFITRSTFMSATPGGPVVSQTTLSVTVVIRSAALLWCLWEWMRHPEPAPGMTGTPGVPSTMTLAERS